MAGQFTVPGGVINFDCPDGLPWNAKENDVPEDVRPAEKKPCGCGKKTTMRQLPTTRPSCVECVQKHLGAAWVLISEHRSGYAHRLLAIGHLFEAEDESQEWPDLHAAIRVARKAFQADGTMPDWDTLAEMAQTSPRAPRPAHKPSGRDKAR